MREVSGARPEFGSLPVREGDLLAGKYRIGGVLGVGGMGIVVAARHEQLDQRLAIKFVRNDALGNADAVERFLREARAAAKLRSEHAAKVLDVGTLESGVPYMVMELLEGSDLGQVLEERGPLSLELAADWIIQACEAVAEAHAAGIVHRDLKPQNLFLALTVGGAAKVKVLDFGVAKSMAPRTGMVGALTRTRATLGSPLYMAPEQMRSSRDVDARADVWALGVVLFELLTQRWPFEAETMPELCLKVVTDPPHSLAGFRPDVPQAFIDVVERCLAKDPSGRFANAAELAAALESFAPAGARAIVARAQMAMASAVPLLLESRQPSPARPDMDERALPSRAPRREPSRRTDRTPAAWGSGRREGKPSDGGGPKRSRAFWIALGIAAIALVGGAVAVANLLAHSATNRTVSMTLNPNPQAPFSAAVAPVSPTSLPLADPAPALVTAKPRPDVPAMVMAAPTPSGAATSSTAVQPTRPAAPPPWNRPSSAARPPTRDDDIPSLR